MNANKAKHVNKDLQSCTVARRPFTLEFHFFLSYACMHGLRSSPYFVMEKEVNFWMVDAVCRVVKQ